MPGSSPQLFSAPNLRRAACPGKWLAFRTMRVFVVMHLSVRCHLHINCCHFRRSDLDTHRCCDSNPFNRPRAGPAAAAAVAAAATVPALAAAAASGIPADCAPWRKRPHASWTLVPRPLPPLPQPPSRPHPRPTSSALAVSASSPTTSAAW